MRGNYAEGRRKFAKNGFHPVFRGADELREEIFGDMEGVFWIPKKQLEEMRGKEIKEKYGEIENKY